VEYTKKFRPSNWRYDQRVDNFDQELCGTLGSVEFCKM
jgi:hypothetical protein